MTNEPVSREAQLLIQLGEMGNALWKARDRCLRLGRDRNLARKLADSAMLESDRLRAQLHREQP